jgi:hypothetical protein
MKFDREAQARDSAERASERYRLELGLWGRLKPAKVEAMARMYSAQAAVMSRVTQTVYEVIDVKVVSVIYRNLYGIFGREVYARWRGIWNSRSEEELELLRLKWQRRGLDPELLVAVQARVIKLLEQSGVRHDQR